MSKQFVCDVCGEPFELDIPHLELVVEEGMEGPAPAGEYDVCTWECMYNLTLAAGDIGEDVEEIPASMRGAVDFADDEEAPEEQIVVQKERPQYAKEVEDAGTGSWFPEGMRVDGRPAAQLRVVNRRDQG